LALFLRGSEIGGIRWALEVRKFRKQQQAQLELHRRLNDAWMHVEHDMKSQWKSAILDLWHCEPEIKVPAALSSTNAWS
jgi:hypothetical protein